MTTVSDQGKAPFLHRVPRAYWGATATALLGFVVSLRFTTRTLDDGVYTCSSQDYFAIGWGVATALLVVLGVREDRSRAYDRLKLSVPVLAVGAAVLLALAVLHVVRGLGYVGGPCNP